MLKSKNPLILTLIFSILIFSSCQTNHTNPKTQTQQETVKIGFFGPLTGDLTNMGDGARNGVTLAFEEIKNNLKNDIQIIYEDTKCDAKTAATAVRKLVEVDQVDVLIGGLCSSETLTAAPTAEANQIPMIAYCSTAPEITQAGEYIFRVVPSDNLEGKFLADYMFNKMDIQKVAVLHVQDKWGEGIYSVFKQNFEKLGGQIIYDQGFVQGTKDFKTHLTKIKQLEPQAIYFLGQNNVSSAFLLQTKSLDIQTTIIGGNTWGDTAIYSLPGAQGAYYSIPNTDWAGDFIKKYQTHFNKEVIACAPQAYDAVRIVGQALTQIPSKKDLQKYLIGLKNYQGASGLISFDANGDLEHAEFEVRQIIDGKSIRVEK